MSTKADQQDKPEVIEVEYMTMAGPFELEMKVHVVLPNAKPARLRFSLAAGQVPTHAEIYGILDHCLQEANANEAAGQIPPGTRLMSKPEFVAYVANRDTGENVVMAGRQDFERPEPMQDRIDHSMLVDAIMGRGVPPALAEQYKQAGIAGYRANPGSSWTWDRAKLEALDTPMLIDIYRRRA